MRSRYVSTPIANTPTSTPVSGESIKGRKASPTAAPPNVVNGSGRSLPPPFAFAMTKLPCLARTPVQEGVLTASMWRAESTFCLQCWLLDGSACPQFDTAPRGRRCVGKSYHATGYRDRSARAHSINLSLRRTRCRWVGRTSTLGNAIGMHLGLFTKLRDMTATKSDTPSMTSRIQTSSLNCSIHNRGTIFLLTWKARSNALNLIVQTTSPKDYRSTRRNARHSHGGWQRCA